MDRLKSCDSFGEISVLETDPITSSIVTATDIELGIITPERLKGKSSRQNFFLKLVNIKESQIYHFELIFLLPNSENSLKL